METSISTLFEQLESSDKNLQYEALLNLLAITEEKVDWAYEVWDDLKSDLTNKDNHKRSRAAQFLSNLAISDPEKRILSDFPPIWQVTKDPKTVTARHSLQAIWRIGLAGEEQLELVIRHLEDRYQNCSSEKNHTLVRYDIIEDFLKLYIATGKEDLKTTALSLIELEEDPKYMKKYAAVWRNK
ncbi:hypothetical protein [Bacillus sp. EB01]|uniref:hypothetical protein n=1 Tax=Bacillus sp. EB01 TaxID=1347086 RepID=UPI0005C5D8DE|nr:hypothetical protein [Bacillus sp. EB01]